MMIGDELLKALFFTTVTVTERERENETEADIRIVDILRSSRK